MKNWNRIEVVFELLVFGIIMGVIEDIIAVKVVTGEQITWRVFGIILVIAIPFAIIGETVIDRVNFVEMFRKIFGNNTNDKQKYDL